MWTSVVTEFGLSSCNSWAQNTGSVMWHKGLVSLWYVGSSWIRDQTCVFCIGRWILYHWATREALQLIFILCFDYIESQHSLSHKYMTMENNRLFLFNFFKQCALELWVALWLINSFRNAKIYNKKFLSKLYPWDFPGGVSTYQGRRHGFDPWSGKIPHVVELRSLCAPTNEPVSEAHELQLLELVLHMRKATAATN